MREIKFRAWDKKTKIWRLWGLGKDCMCDLQIYDFLTYYGLYTGLKDSSDPPIEIYEGDIVKWSDIKAEVYWDQTDVAFSLRYQGESWFLNEDAMLDDMEIIGNVYENPELVKP